MQFGENVHILKPWCTWGLLLKSVGRLNVFEYPSGLYHLVKLFCDLILVLNWFAWKTKVPDWASVLPMCLHTELCSSAIDFYP